jgi:hypothetical protein
MLLGLSWSAEGTPAGGEGEPDTAGVPDARENLKNDPYGPLGGATGATRDVAQRVAEACRGAEPTARHLQCPRQRMHRAGEAGSQVARDTGRMAKEAMW